MESSPNTRTGVVAAPQAEAAWEGARVLEDGGNAADALVTAALVQGVVDPHRCGMGGFGCATVHFPSREKPLSIDFHGRAGSLSREDQWTELFESAAPDGFGYILTGKVNDVGYGAITTPGMVAGIGEIHRRFGTLPWRELVLRAVRYAEEGFLVTPDLAEFWVRPGLHGRVSTRERLTATETGRRFFLKADGSTYRAGDVLRQPLLASTYRRLAEGGPESLYRGAIAEEIHRDWEAHGALVTRDDLRSYRAEVQAPLERTYRGHRVLTTPLPGGGVALLQALALAEKHLPRGLGHNSPEYIDAVAPILRAVWADRLSNHGDPRFGGPTAAELLSTEYLASLHEPPPLESGGEPGGTTQLTIVDAEQNVISFSHSLGYGSGVFSPTLGFMYNNCMSAFDPRPGARNSVAPGKARTTAVAETVVLRGDVPCLVLGSPGAARITAGLVEVLLNIVDFGMNVAEAVVCPRFDAYGERRLVLDSRFPLPLVASLRARGWDVQQSPKPFGSVGRIYAVEIEPDGRLIAGVDPGEPGAAFRARSS